MKRTMGFQEKKTTRFKDPYGDLHYGEKTYSICLAFEMHYYYILSKAHFFPSPSLLKNMVIAPFPHVVNFKFREELSLLKLFIFPSLLVSMVAARIELL